MTQARSIQLIEELAERLDDMNRILMHEVRNENAQAEPYRRHVKLNVETLKRCDVHVRNYHTAR